MVTRRAALLALEVVFVLLTLTGVGLIHVPTALILGGVLGVLAVERNDAEGGKT